MSRFLSELRITPLDDGVMWRVDDEFEYRIGSDTSYERVIVPIGFLTDLGSVPQLFWNIIPPIGKPLRAYILHDYLYSTQTYVRAKADKILLEAMGVAGVSFIKRWTIYLAVRSGGWIAWKNNIKEIKNVN